MKLYLLRHGKSPSPLEAGVKTDAERPLSHDGRDDARKAARFLLAQGAKPEIILSSPLRRALQTAHEAAQVLKGPEPRIYDPLSNQISGTELLRKVCAEEGRPNREVLLVGHQPQLGDLASFLTSRMYDLKPAGLIALESERSGGGKLLWWANPTDMP